jgi:hypothetical protein
MDQRGHAGDGPTESGMDQRSHARDSRQRLVTVSLTRKLGRRHAGRGRCREGSGDPNETTAISGLTPSGCPHKGDPTRKDVPEKWPGKVVQKGAQKSAPEKCSRKSGPKKWSASSARGPAAGRIGDDRGVKVKPLRAQSGKTVQKCGPKRQSRNVIQKRSLERSPEKCSGKVVRKK